MPSRKVTVQLVGDSGSLERAFSRSEAKGKSFGNSMGTATSSLKGLAKAGAVGAAVGGVALLTSQLIKSVSAAKEAEVAETGLRQALKQSGNSFRRYGKEIDSAITRTSKLAGIDDEELSVSFANLVRSTGSVTKAQKGMNLAANIARARSISLASATKMVERAYKGSDTALRRIGIVVPKVSNAYDTLKQQEKDLTEQLDGATAAEKKVIEAKIETIKQSYEAARASDKQASAQNAIAEAQKKFAGSAEAYGKTAAGAQEKLAVAWENVQEKLGQKLLPVLVKVSNKTVELIEYVERNWPKWKSKIDEVKLALDAVWKVLDPLVKLAVPGGNATMIGVVMSGLLVTKLIGVANAVKLIRTRLALLAATRFVIPVAIALSIKGPMKRFFEDYLGANFQGPQAAGDLMPVKRNGKWVDPNTGTPVPDQQFWNKRAASLKKLASPRQHGGPVESGRTYIVGERGPELLTMGRGTGFVTPNAGGGTITVVAPIYLDGREIARVITHQQQRASKSVGSQTRGGFGGNPVAAFG